MISIINVIFSFLIFPSNLYRYYSYLINIYLFNNLLQYTIIIYEAIFWIYFVYIIIDFVRIFELISAI